MERCGRTRLTMTRVERRTSLTVFATAGLVLCCLLLRFPPEHYGFYPVCPIYAWTGLLCPGCGGTRALAALLHGNVAEAWRLNALVVGLLPLALGYGAVLGWRVWRGEPHWPKVPRGVWVGIGVVAAGFTVARNFA
jgi:hypothetical protein